MHTYEVNIQWTEDRKGTLHSPVLPAAIEVATPPEFPGGIAGIWSPEHLFVASVVSCLMTTFLAIAGNSKLDFKKFECTATGTVDQVDGKYVVTEIILKPQLTITDNQQEDRAKHILEMSEKACLISNSIKTKLQLIPAIVIE